MIGSVRISGVILAMLLFTIGSAAFAAEFETAPSPALNLSLDPNKLQPFDPLAVTPLKPPSSVQPVQKASRSDQEGAHLAPLLGEASNSGSDRASDDFLLRHAFGIQLKSNF